MPFLVSFCLPNLILKPNESPPAGAACATVPALPVPLVASTYRFDRGLDGAALAMPRRTCGKRRIIYCNTVRIHVYIYIYVIVYI